MSSLAQQNTMPYSDRVTEADDQFDVWMLIDTILSRPRLILMVFLSVFGLGVLYIIFATPEYQADVLIQVEEKKGTALASLQQIASALDISQSPVAGETEILQSRDVIGKAIDQLHLDVLINVKHKIPFISSRFEHSVGGRGKALANSYFGLDNLGWGGERMEVDSFELPDGEYFKSFLLYATSDDTWTLINSEQEELAHGKIGELVKFQTARGPGLIRVASILARKGNTFVLTKISKAAAYARILKSINAVETAKQSSVVRLTYIDDDPIEAVNIANTIARAYLTQNVSRRSEEAEKSLAFLEQQLPQLKKAVEESEQSFNNYRLSRHSVNLDKESESLLSRSVDLEKQRIDSELKLQQVRQRYQANHPDVIALTGQLKSLADEESKLGELIKRLPETQQESLRLERDVKVNTDLYIALLNNAQQLRIGKAGTIGNVRVIDFAIPADDPSKPKTFAVLAGAAILGVVFGIFSAIVSRALRPTMRNPDFIERTTGLPTYGTIPESKVQSGLLARTAGKLGKLKASGNKLLATIDPNDSAIEALRSMRVGLQFAMSSAENKCLLITGPTPGLGKTFISVNLSAVLATTGKKVLLIDCDMRRPRVGEYLSLQKEPGLSNYLAGGATLAEILHKEVVPNLDVICSGKVPPNPSELLVRGELKALLDSMHDQYDLIILDSPPLLPVGDSVAVSKLVGSVFMVVRANLSTTIEFVDAVKRLENAGVAVKGTIFNGVEVSRYGYGYRYRYYSYNYYGSSKS